MSNLQTTIACPRCQAPITAHIEQVVDVGRDPGAKNRLLQGRLNLAQCGSCGFAGALSTPIVYHDPIKELLLTFVPPELRMSTLEQEQILGKLTQQLMQSIAPELRKGYLLRPQTMLTMQGLVERVLEGDGITREVLAQQRAKSQLLQQIIQAEPEARRTMIREHDSEIDTTFFTIANTFGQAAASSGDNALAQRILQTRTDLMENSTAGRRLQTQRAEMEKAAQDLKSLEGKLTLERLVQLVAAAPSLDRVTSLAAFAWQYMDYGFFQSLTEKVEAATGAEKERLTAIRDRAVEDVTRLQQGVQAEMNGAAGLLTSILEAPDTDRAIEQYLPDFNDVFFAVMEANLESAKRNKQTAAFQRLEVVQQKIMAALENSLPKEIRFARDLLGQKTDAEAEAMLEGRAAEINDTLVAALKAASEDPAIQDHPELAARLAALTANAEKHLALARFTSK
jgi:hypothetical protein